MRRRRASCCSPSIGTDPEEFDVGSSIYVDVYDENGDALCYSAYVYGLDPVEQTAEGYRLDIRPLLEDPASYIDIAPSLSEQAAWYDFEIDFFVSVVEEGEDYWETIKIYEDTYDLDLKADGSVLPMFAETEIQIAEDGSIFIPVEWNDARPGELVLLLRAGDAMLIGTQFVPGGENWEGYRSYWFDSAEGASIAVSLEAGEDGYRGSVSACIEALLEGFAQNGASLPGEGFDMRNVFMTFSFAEVGEDGSVYLFGDECSIRAQNLQKKREVRRMAGLLPYDLQDPAHTFGMKRKIMPQDEVKSRDERESCIPAFAPAEERYDR